MYWESFCGARLDLRPLSAPVAVYALHYRFDPPLSGYCMADSCTEYRTQTPCRGSVYQLHDFDHQ